MYSIIDKIKIKDNILFRYFIYKIMIYSLLIIHFNTIIIINLFFLMVNNIDTYITRKKKLLVSGMIKYEEKCHFFQCHMLLTVIDMRVSKLCL